MPGVLACIASQHHKLVCRVAPLLEAAPGLVEPTNLQTEGEAGRRGRRSLLGNSDGAVGLAIWAGTGAGATSA